ncbi:MAG: septation protein A [Neisseriaceae bacterium]
MKFLLDFLVLVLFFGTYSITKNIYTATEVAIGGGLLQLLVAWIQLRRLEGMQVVNFLIVLIFGGATLLLRDKVWIQLKPTILYWTFALILSGGRVFQKNLLRKMLGDGLALPARIWNHLLWAWIVFFVCLGMLNWWVVHQFSLGQWVTFKVFGTTALLILFLILQGIYIYPFFKSTPPRKG